MPKALANRLCHMEIESNFESWRRWAISSGVSYKVIGFLSFRHDYLIENESSSDALAFPTPRSWEMVSRLLNMSGQDQERVYSMISGCVGSGIASEFCSWCRVFANLPKIEDIFNGKCHNVPKETDSLYALISSMTSYAREHKDDITAITYSIDYALSMPADFAAVLFKSYMAIEENYKSTLMKIPLFNRWYEKKGRLLNGN